MEKHTPHYPLHEIQRQMATVPDMNLTTHANHRVWQDVYHGEFNGTALYVKFQQAGAYFVVSFKEL